MSGIIAPLLADPIILNGGLLLGSTALIIRSCIQMKRIRDDLHQDLRRSLEDASKELKADLKDVHYELKADMAELNRKVTYVHGRLDGMADGVRMARQVCSLQYESTREM